MRFLGIFIAIFFPWIIFLLEDSLILAIVSLALQVTIIGWIPIMMVAIKHLDNLPYFAKRDARQTSENNKN